jgi:Ser/Thr protein kinase RdoA (MazF antagonist)
MDKAQFDELSGKLDRLKDVLQTPVRTLALVQLAGMYYTEAERRTLMREYGQCLARVKEATTRHKKALAGPAKDAAWDEVSRLHIEEKAMSNEHPLIAALVRLADAIVGNAYMLHPDFRPAY